jgi:fatty acid desaturase
MSDRQLPSHTTDDALRNDLAGMLPRDFFAASPLRLGYLAAALCALFACLWTTHRCLIGSWPTWAYLVTTLLAAFFYPCFLFTLHEIGHGAIVRNRTTQLIFGWIAAFWIGFQPTFWIRMHAHHHRHANTEQDTDRLRFYDRGEPGARFLDFRLGNPVSIPSAVFAIQIVYAFCFVGFLSGQVSYPLTRARVVGEAAFHAVCAACFIYLIGTKVWMFGYLPMLVLGCAVQNMYVISNHLTRPLTRESDALETAQSVHLAGWSHMGFGRHVEHHLFPVVPHSKLRHVTELLRARYPAGFVETPLTIAIRTLFSLPGYYLSHTELTDRFGRTRVPIR